jgi:FkbM family methyltransferase
MKIIQIGSNRGHDDVTKILNGTQPELLVLVEPMNIHNEKLNECYSWVNNKFIENIAISKIDNEDIDFYYHLDDGPGYEVASTDKKHIYERHTHLNPERIDTIKVKSLTINSLFLKYDLKFLDVLFIDAEGLDDTIIFDINFNSIEIKKIYFENLHIKNENIYEYLNSKNYSIIKNTGHNGWTTLAEKK